MSDCLFLLVSQIITRLSRVRESLPALLKVGLKEKFRDLFSRTLSHLIKKLKIVYNTIRSFVRISRKFRSKQSRGEYLRLFSVLTVPLKLFYLFSHFLLPLRSQETK